MVRQMRTVSVCSPTSVNSWLPKVESVLSRPVISTASYTAVPSGGRKAVAAVRGVPNPTVFHANAAPPISAPSRANTTRGGHHGRSGRGGAQDGSTSVCASGSSGSVLQSCTGNGDQGWSSARDTGTSCQSNGGRPRLNPPQRTDNTRTPPRTRAEPRDRSRSGGSARPALPGGGAGPRPDPDRRP